MSDNDNVRWYQVVDLQYRDITGLDAYPNITDGLKVVAHDEYGNEVVTYVRNTNYTLQNPAMLCMASMGLRPTTMDEVSEKNVHLPMREEDGNYYVALDVVKNNVQT